MESFGCWPSVFFIVALCGPRGGNSFVHQKKYVNVADWALPENPCPSKLVSTPYPKLSAINVTGWACDWDKILALGYSDYCSQVFVRVGRYEVNVACLPEKKIYRSVHIERLEGSVFEHSHSRQKRERYDVRNRRKSLQIKKDFNVS